ncbi:MAG: carboxymuconolactone decarboxylase family protein [Chloroflexi bacterium]|nr:carboxymuconolactone decarboxylase family protein [Chloroflexota bacterium]
MKPNSLSREAFIEPPPALPFYLQLGIWFAEREAGRTLLPARLLAWYPKAAVSSGVIESLIADGRGDLDPRTLRLVRLQVSLAVSCPFCIRMNSVESDDSPISPDELSALRGQRAPDSVSTFTARERIAVEYARLISQTPLKFPPQFVSELTANFSEREIVILATTAAQVNYWARLIQALGVPV